MSNEDKPKSVGSVVKDLWIEDEVQIRQQNIPLTGPSMLAFAAERRHLVLVQVIQESTDRILAGLAAIRELSMDALDESKRRGG
jgi:hypothetical protein